ncbi:MAG: hypothetical protein LLG42_00080, partial [Chloroflexi bacterium]|nr:hypothetical protein [Chloroflexota bacterium]
RSWKLNKKEIVWILGSLFTFSLILIAATTWNYSAGTMDSISKIMYGKSFAYDGITALNQSALGVMGSYMIIMQSISVFINADYMYLVEPAFAFSLFAIFLLLGKEILSSKVKNWLPVTLLILGLFASTYFIRFQIFYIHDNLIAASYLLMSLASFWLNIKDKNPYWLIFGMLGLLGFSLTRIEAPLFAICFLAIVVSTQQVPKKHQLTAFIPFLSLIILWYFRIYLTLDTGGRFLKPDNTLFTIGILFAFGLYIYLSSKIVWIEEKITSKLHRVMILALLLALVFFIIQKPDHVFTNISTIIENFYVNGLWGSTSILLTFLLVFLPLPNSKHVEDRIFSTGITVFLILMVLIGGLRNPYRVSWSDSANRMMVHIIPSACLYLIVRYRNFTEASQSQIDELIQEKKFQFLIVGISMLVLILMFSIGFNLLI